MYQNYTEKNDFRIQAGAEELRKAKGELFQATEQMRVMEAQADEKVNQLEDQIKKGRRKCKLKSTIFSTKNRNCRPILMNIWTTGVLGKNLMK